MFGPSPRIRYLEGLRLTDSGESGHKTTCSAEAQLSLQTLLCVIEDSSKEDVPFEGLARVATRLRSAIPQLVRPSHGQAGPTKSHGPIRNPNQLDPPTGLHCLVIESGPRLTETSWACIGAPQRCLASYIWIPLKASNNQLTFDWWFLHWWFGAPPGPRVQIPRPIQTAKLAASCRLRLQPEPARRLGSSPEEAACIGDPAILLVVLWRFFSLSSSPEKDTFKTETLPNLQRSPFKITSPCI